MAEAHLYHLEMVPKYYKGSSRGSLGVSLAAFSEIWMVSRIQSVVIKNKEKYVAAVF